MSKYSSESESESSKRKRHSGKNKGRSRSSSESSNDSRQSYRKKSRKRKRYRSKRSRSRDRHGKSSRSRYSHHGDDRSHSSRRSRSTSRSKERHRSRDRSWSKGKGIRSRSSSTEKSKSTSPSHRRYDDDRSRSKSDKYNKWSPTSSSPDSRSQSKHGASSSYSQNGSNKPGLSSEEQLRAKLQQAIRAAQTADELLRQQGVLVGGQSRREELPAPDPVHQTSVIEEINAPSFIQKQFLSSKTTTQNSPLRKQGTLTDVLPPKTVRGKGELNRENIFHPSLLVDQKQKLDRWVKKLFNIRQKAINGDPF